MRELEVDASPWNVEVNPRIAVNRRALDVHPGRAAPHGEAPRRLAGSQTSTAEVERIALRFIYFHAVNMRAIREDAAERLP